jgi:hypothetical protein
MNIPTSPTAAVRARRKLTRAMTLLLTAGLVALSSGLAVADDDDHHDRGHEQRGNHGNQGYRHREWREEDRAYGYRPVYPQPYVYAQPVYVPPPVYYAPRQSPGISLFFPLDLR